jgi:hypothetical protein
LAGTFPTGKEPIDRVHVPVDDQLFDSGPRESVPFRTSFANGRRPLRIALRESAGLEREGGGLPSTDTGPACGLEGCEMGEVVVGQLGREMPFELVSILR